MKKNCNSPVRARQWAGARRISEAARAMRQLAAPAAEAVKTSAANLKTLRAALKDIAEAVRKGEVAMLQHRGERHAATEALQQAERDLSALEDATSNHWAKFGPPGFYGGLRFDALPVDASPQRADVVSKVRAFGAEGAPFGNLVIAGQAGTGKTTLLACKLATYDAAGLNLEFIDHAAFTRKFRDAGRGEYARLLAHYGESVAVLALDDVGAGSAGAGGETFAAEVLTDVLNLRVAHRVPTICTTNAQPEDLCNWLGGPGGRGWSRLSGGMLWVSLVGADLRRTNVSLQSDAPPFSPRLERLARRVDRLAARLAESRESVELAEKHQQALRTQRTQVAGLVANTERLQATSQRTHAEVELAAHQAECDARAAQQWIAAQVLADHSGALSRKAVLRRARHLRARHPEAVQFELEGCMAGTLHDLPPEFLATFAEQLDSAVEPLPEAEPLALPSDGAMALCDATAAACEAARLAPDPAQVQAHMEQARHAAREAARIADEFARAAEGLPKAVDLFEGAIAGDESKYITASNAEIARMWANAAAAQLAEAEATLAA